MCLIRIGLVVVKVVCKLENWSHNHGLKTPTVLRDIVEM